MTAMFGEGLSKTFRELWEENERLRAALTQIIRIHDNSESIEGGDYAALALCAYEAEKALKQP